MPLQNIHLRKLLKIGFSEARQRQSALRADIREENARQTRTAGGGGDFYAPFWADAKRHALGTMDLRQAVRERIAANGGAPPFTRRSGTASCNGGKSGGA